MAKAWFEGENIFIAPDNIELPLPENSISVPDDTNIWQLQVVDGALILKDSETILNERKNKLLNDLKHLLYTKLSQTDWIVTKAVELDMRVSDLEPEIAAQREQYRANYAQIKEQILSAESLESLPTDLSL